MTTVHAYTTSAGARGWTGRQMAAGPCGGGESRAHDDRSGQGHHEGAASVRGAVRRRCHPRPRCRVGSIPDITIVTQRETGVEEVNRIFEEEARSDRYRGVMGVTRDPIVSSDIIRDPHGALVDLTLTQVVGGNARQGHGMVRQRVGLRRANGARGGAPEPQRQRSDLSVVQSKERWCAGHRAGGRQSRQRPTQGIERAQGPLKATGIRTEQTARTPALDGVADVPPTVPRPAELQSADRGGVSLAIGNVKDTALIIAVRRRRPALPS